MQPLQQSLYRMFSNPITSLATCCRESFERISYWQFCSIWSWYDPILSGESTIQYITRWTVMVSGVPVLSARCLRITDVCHALSPSVLSCYAQTSLNQGVVKLVWYPALCPENIHQSECLKDQKTDSDIAMCISQSRHIETLILSKLQLHFIKYFCSRIYIGHLITNIWINFNHFAIF
jgi:hypothetical protein